MPKTITTTTTKTFSDSSETYTNLRTNTANSREDCSPSVPAAKVGQLTTRTDNDTGVLTMNSGHGFATSDKVDVFWSGGSRRNMTATVATNAVTVDGGSGDNLPVLNTAVTAMKPTEVDFVVTGDDVVSLDVSSPKLGYVVFVDDADADIADATFEIESAGVGKVWDAGDGADNPLAGVTTSKAKFSHGDSTGAVTMRAAAYF